MIPEKGSDYVSIPITFDVTDSREDLSLNKLFIGLGITIGGIIAMVVLFFVAEDDLKPQLPIIVGVGVFLFVRFFFLKERYYMIKRDVLVQNDYKFNTNLFWGIYAINNYFPYICKLANGFSCIFVAFDKDIIVGRDIDDDYYHFEAVSDAYDLMFKKGIYCMHIDYADTVGKDDRMDSLFDNLNSTSNSEVRAEVSHIYDHVLTYMMRVYASYDVYAFYYKGSDQNFWDDLQPVLNAFCRANYVRDRILTREEIGELCKTLLNLNDFSVTRANERVFLSNVNSKSRLKVIWTERDGVRTVVERTKDEIRAENKVRDNEIYAIKQRKRKRRKWGKHKDDKDIEIPLDDINMTDVEIEDIDFDDTDISSSEIDISNTNDSENGGNKVENGDKVENDDRAENGIGLSADDDILLDDDTLLSDDDSLVTDNDGLNKDNKSTNV